MEPYRPIVDQVVLRIHEKGHEDLNQEVKRALAAVLTADQVIVGSTSPLFKHMHNLSFAVSELFIVLGSARYRATHLLCNTLSQVVQA